MLVGYLFICGFLISGASANLDADPLGYIAYCPCMGRFGNQADHFLGALAFARGLNRTLVLPAWVEYRYGEPRSIQVPFNTYFQVDPLRQYHKVITMEDFMADVAPHEWPLEKRVSFCYTSRGDGGTCNAKGGNPFGPFWDTYDIDFVSSEFYGPLHYDMHHQDMTQRWNKKYPPSDWPVLAFTGAPASFPVQPENRGLQKYLKWAPEIVRKAEEFINATLPQGAFVGVHLRNGIDWVRACEHVPQSPNLFAAPQCLGYRGEKGKATIDMCLPTKETIIRQLKRTIKSYNNSPNQKSSTVKSVFVSSDNNHMITELNEALSRMKVSVHKYPTQNVHVDLAILGMSHHFIGNCISSFSAFVKRERDGNGFKSTFWAFPAERTVRDEL